MDGEAQGIKGGRDTADGTALAGRIPALESQDGRNLLVEGLDLEHPQAVLVFLQFLLIFLFRDGLRQVGLAQDIELLVAVADVRRRERMFFGFRIISHGLLQHFHNGREDLVFRHVHIVATDYVPRRIEGVRLLQHDVVPFFELLVTAFFRIDIRKRFPGLAQFPGRLLAVLRLLLLRNMDKELDQAVMAVGQHLFEFVDVVEGRPRADIALFHFALVLLVVPAVAVDGHVPRLGKKLPVPREERHPAAQLVELRRRKHAEPAGIHVLHHPAQDFAAAGMAPPLEEDDDRQSRVAGIALHLSQLIAQAFVENLLQLVLLQPFIQIDTFQHHNSSPSFCKAFGLPSTMAIFMPRRNSARLNGGCRSTPAAGTGAPAAATVGSGRGSSWGRGRSSADVSGGSGTSSRDGGGCSAGAASCGTALSGRPAGPFPGPKMAASRFSSSSNHASSSRGGSPL